MTDQEQMAGRYGFMRRLRLTSPIARVAVLGLLLAAMTSTLGASGHDPRWVVPSSASSGDQAWLDELVGPVPSAATTQAAPPPDVAVLPFGGDPKVLVLPGAAGAGDSARGASAPADAPDTGVLTSSGIPVRVLKAYVAAAAQTAKIEPSCHLSWSLLAGIGRVESDHGRFGGSQVDANGVVHPPIYGPRLDGTGGMPFIRDTDGGRLDGDPVADRAVGPMQFIPGTWAVYGTDADGNGVANPQDVDDAALSAARYLCDGGADLATQDGRFRAVFRYNGSTSYVRLVLALADSYAHGEPVPVSAEPTVQVTQSGQTATGGSPPAVNPDSSAPSPSQPANPSPSPSPSPSP
ncbi:MAG: lytic transglycosylase domain-containing protein, partial [Kineosporiaceae bacterium]